MNYWYNENINEPQKYHAEWKMLNTKEYVSGFPENKT